MPPASAGPVLAEVCSNAVTRAGSVAAGTLAAAVGVAEVVGAALGVPVTVGRAVKGVTAATYFGLTPVYLENLTRSICSRAGRVVLLVGTPVSLSPVLTTSPSQRDPENARCE